MKSVLGIIGSPRRMGNCELLVKEIAARLPEPAALLARDSCQGALWTGGWGKGEG